MESISSKNTTIYVFALLTCVISLAAHLIPQSLAVTGAFSSLVISAAQLIYKGWFPLLCQSDPSSSGCMVLNYVTNGASLLSSLVLLVVCLKLMLFFYR